MRKCRLSEVRHTTSSRQSPKISPSSTGSDLVPLFEAQEEQLSKVEVVPLEKLYFVTDVPSSSSRSRSASHHAAKLVDEGCEEVRRLPARLKSPTSILRRRRLRACRTTRWRHAGSPTR